jgi:hypothetical protein
MNQHDILLNIKGELVWVTEIFADELSRAITDAIQIMGKGEYVGHKSFSIVDGAWIEV